MYYDIGRLTIHGNRCYLNNWALGIDYYHIEEGWEHGQVVLAKVCIVNFLFFNLTFTWWT